MPYAVNINRTKQIFSQLCLMFKDYRLSIDCKFRKYVPLEPKDSVDSANSTERDRKYLVT